jgi:hypothetical protein
VAKEDGRTLRAPNAPCDAHCREPRGPSGRELGDGADDTEKGVVFDDLGEASLVIHKVLGLGNRLLPGLLDMTPTKTAMPPMDAICTFVFVDGDSTHSDAMSAILHSSVRG